jgi:hypothetical protein
MCRDQKYLQDISFNYRRGTDFPEWEIPLFFTFKSELRNFFVLHFNS